MGSDRWFGELRRLWDEIIPSGPRCRGCADSDVFGTCDRDGLPCDSTERALSLVRKLKSEGRRGYDQMQVVAMLKSEINGRGDQLALAKRIGISPQWLTDILKGHRSPTGRVLAYLGLKRVPVYVRVSEADASPAPDPIADAVHADLAPVINAVVDFGHKLAEGDPPVTCPTCGAIDAERVPIVEADASPVKETPFTRHDEPTPEQAEAEARVHQRLMHELEDGTLARNWADASRGKGTDA